MYIKPIGFIKSIKMGGKTLKNNFILYYHTLYALVLYYLLGKGRTEGKLVLDAAIWIIKCSEEEKAGVPMEIEENVAKDGGEDGVLADGDMEMLEIFKVPSSSSYSSGGSLKRQITKNINLIYSVNTHNIKYLNITSPEPCSLAGVIEHINFKKKVVFNPSLWAEESKSGISRGHGVVKRARAFGEREEENESVEMVTDGGI